MPRSYPQKLVVEIKALFVQEGRSPHEISSIYGNKPTQQCIHKWSTKVDKFGKTWKDYREEFLHDHYLAQASPRSLMSKVILRINEILDEPNFDGKDADKLSKLNKTFKELVHPAYHAQTLYVFLEDLILFTREHYPALVTQEFTDLMRDFKNEIRDRVQLGGKANP